MDAPVDFGPSASRTKDGRIVSSGPGAVVLEDRDDPDPQVKHAVRGARRYSVLAYLRREGVTTKRQDDAANRFLDDLCRAQGGSSASFLGGIRGSESPAGLSEGQRKAIRSVERVRLMLGLSPDTVTWWVILDNRTPAEFDAKHGLRHGTAADWLRKALDTLDEHYNPSGRGN